MLAHKNTLLAEIPSGEKDYFKMMRARGEVVGEITSGRGRDNAAMECYSC
jgi:hypothetical protein